MVETLAEVLAVDKEDVHHSDHDDVGLELHLRDVDHGGSCFQPFYTQKKKKLLR